MFPKTIQIVFNFIAFAVLVLTTPINNNIENSSIDDSIKIINASNNNSLPDGLSFVEFNEEYNYLDFPFEGWSDEKYLIDLNLKVNNYNVTGFTFQFKEMTGSSFLVPNKENNGYYFGRNFNSNESNNLIVITHPDYYYSSISTVNTNFIKQLENANVELTDELLNFISIYAPLDGMNENGVSISINMNQNIPTDKEPGYETIDQNTKGLFYISSTFMIRAVLDIASNADDAIDLIQSFNLHNTFNYNIHYMISDSTGKSYVVEYINNEMIVTESSVVTNFYITEKEHPKSDLGLEKFNIINDMITKTPNMSLEEVKNTLSTTKENTQWSVIYDLLNKEAIYYSKENYEQGYKVKLNFTPKSTELPYDETKDFETIEVKATKDIQEFKENSRIVEFTGDDGLDAVLEKGGFTNELDLFSFISEYKKCDISNLYIDKSDFSCSAFSVLNEKGNGYYFGRNYDFKSDDPLIMIVHPDNGYSSISTVDTHFVVFKEDSPNNDEVLKLASLYLPLDGLNEKGVSISINAVPGYWTIHQNVNGKGNITTGMAVRLILDKAATVDEAVELIKKSNIHFSVDKIIHITISDASGKTVVVEFFENEIFVIESRVVTNFYLVNQLKKYNNNVLNNDKRYEKILDRITKIPNQTVKDVRNTLRYGNQGDFTKWSIVYDQLNLEATYFFRNNYDVGYHVKLFDNNNNNNSEIPDPDDETIVNSDEETEGIFDDDDDSVVEEVDDTSTIIAEEAED